MRRQCTISVSADQQNLQNVPGILQARRQAIFYSFKLFGSPPADEWKETKIEQLIMDQLKISKSSKRNVQQVLESIVEQESLPDYDTFNPTFNRKVGINLMMRKKMPKGNRLTQVSSLYYVHILSCLLSLTLNFTSITQQVKIQILNNFFKLFE